MYLLILLAACTVIDSKIAQGDDLKAFFSYSTFNSPSEGPFVETYLSIVGHSANYQKLEDGKFQSQIDITITFEKEGNIEKFKKYQLMSPKVGDTATIDFNFIDQQRFLLPNGKYDLTFKLIDHYGDTIPSVINQKVEILYPEDQVNVSGIQLVESASKAAEKGALTKSGYDLVPYVDNFYPQSSDAMTFYTEIYNTDKIMGEGNKFLTMYSIKSYETGQLVSRFVSSLRMKTAPVQTLLKKFDIRQLPSGNYNLVVEVRDKHNEVIASNRLFFQRSNPDIQMELNDITAVGIENTFVQKFTDADTLREHIRSIRPISTQIEQAFMDRNLENMELKEMQQYFLNFWMGRSSLRPEHAWKKYKKRVDVVNELFSTITRKGYDTDRGRVYLEYGDPNTRAVRHHDPRLLPYEIWHYYSIKNQRNAKFLFFSRDDVTNDFELLHSNLRGELRNRNWLSELYDGSPSGNVEMNSDRIARDLDNRANESWGSDVLRLWNSPY